MALRCTATDVLDTTEGFFRSSLQHSPALRARLIPHEAKHVLPRRVRPYSLSARSRSATLFLGNLDDKRDWGHARDYVEGMWQILQQPKPDDYVLATGETHSVREFVEKAFAQIGMCITWQGAGADGKGIDAGSGRVLVKVDARYFRPTEVDR